MARIRPPALCCVGIDITGDAFAASSAACAAALA